MTSFLKSIIFALRVPVFVDICLFVRCRWSNNLKLHKSSAISSHSDLALCLCCDEISRGVGQPMIKAATAVHPLLILLFHNEVQELDSAATDNFSLFKVSPVIRFTSDCKTASLVASVRKVLKHVVLSLVHGSFIDAEIQVNHCFIFQFDPKIENFNFVWNIWTLKYMN